MKEKEQNIQTIMYKVHFILQTNGATKMCQTGEQRHKKLYNQFD